MILTESMSIGEKFLNTLGITILGMFVVFIVLVIIAYSLELLRIFFGEKNKKKAAEEYVEAKSDIAEEISVKENNDDVELVVLLTAAIAAFESTSSQNIIVRSIRKLPQNKNVWAAAGRQQLMSANNITGIRR